MEIPAIKHAHAQNQLRVEDADATRKRLFQSGYKQIQRILRNPQKNLASRPRSP